MSSNHHTADTMIQQLRLDCETVHLAYVTNGVVFITSDDDRGDTYEIPLEIWRTFTALIEKLEGE